MTYDATVRVSRHMAATAERLGFLVEHEPKSSFRKFRVSAPVEAPNRRKAKKRLVRFLFDETFYLARACGCGCGYRRAVLKGQPTPPLG